MNYDQAREALKGYDVRSMGQNGSLYEIIIGNAGKNLNGTRRFQAKTLDTIVKQVKNTYKL